MHLLERIFSRKNDTKKRKESEINFQAPLYKNRHTGKDFLVLGTGPSLNLYEKKIKKFTEQNQLITIGANHITPFMTPDYHGFANRQRLQSFGKTISKKSKALMSVYFTDETIQKYCPQEFEWLQWKDPKDPKHTSVDSMGVISHQGTTSTLLMMVAYVMGARKIYVAGIDGYADFFGKKGNSHYKDIQYKINISDNERNAKYQYWEKIQDDCLKSIADWQTSRGAEPFEFLTPGRYTEYYNPSCLENLT